jgi:hypothetical protein
MEAKRPDITIVSAGLCGFDDLTATALRHLQQAHTIYYSGFNGNPNQQLLSPSAEIINLDEGRYVYGAYRPQIYEDMASVIVERARASPGLVVLQPGSAMLIDTVTKHVLRKAQQHNLGVNLICGVSSIESVLCQLRHCVLDALQVFLAQAMILKRMPIQRSIDTIIMQPGYYDTLWWSGLSVSKSGRFDGLFEYIGRFVRPADEAALVISPCIACPKGLVFWFEFGDIREICDRISPFHTLFIPRSEELSDDPQFADRIRSWAIHQASMTRDAGQGETERIWFNHDCTQLPERLRARSLEIGRRRGAS